jgi:hypothetical protein
VNEKPNLIAHFYGSIPAAPPYSWLNSEFIPVFSETAENLSVRGGR